MLRIGRLDRADQPVPGREPGRGVLDRRRQHRRPGRAGPSGAWASAQERTAPGTVIASGPRSGIRSRPPARSAAASMPAGARPDPLSATCSPAASSQTSQNASPADPAAVGHHDAQDGVRGDGRVHGVAAGGQDRQAGGRREVVGRDDGPAGAAGEPRRDQGRIELRLGPPGARDRLAADRCSYRRRRLMRQQRDRQQHERRRRRSRRGPAPPPATPTEDAPGDLAQPQEHRVQAHDRAAIVGVRLGHVGEQADRGRGRAGQHEQSAARDRRRSASRSGRIPSPTWLMRHRGHEQHGAARDPVQDDRRPAHAS